MAISLEIVTPRGILVSETELDSVVVRRRETRFERGSEIAVLTGHAPAIVRLPPHELRYRRGSALWRVAVRGGWAEVLDDRVTVIAEDAERLGIEPERCPGEAA